MLSLFTWPPVSQYEYEAVCIGGGCVHLISEERRLGAPTGDLSSVATTADAFGEMASDDEVGALRLGLRWRFLCGAAARDTGYWQPA